MQKSYTSNYLNIYFWQGISILLNFFSLFLVTPKLTSQPVIYGTYMVCISATIFLSYADLGFVSASFKYASEFFGAQKKLDEIKITAFGAFVLFIFVIIISIGFLLLSIYPEFLFAKFNSLEEKRIASILFLILSIFSLNIVLQRTIQIIFGIRLEDYVYQRINIILSLVKITSVFYFFRLGIYDIIGYFLFSQVMNVIGSFIGFIIAKRRYHYDIVEFVKNFRFSVEQYKKTKNLAFGSIYLTFLWILYYELDSFAIVRLLGAEYVAYFAIGVSLMTVFRTIYGTLYNPFAARFNHFIGCKDYEGLKTFYLSVITITLPIVLFPTITLIFLMRSFIICWIGTQYTSSIIVASFLMSSYLLGFISNPAGIMMIALEKLKQIYVVNTVIAIIYWGGIILTISKLNIVSFGLFKFVAFFIAGLMYIRFSLHIIGQNLFNFFNQVFKPSLLPVFIMSIILYILRQYLPLYKDKLNLIIVIFAGVVSTVIGLIVYFFTSDIFKNFIMELKTKYIDRGKNF